MFATIKKELLILLRDPSGLILLLLMPAILIIVMALVQDAPYKSYRHLSIKTPVINYDKGYVGKKIIENLKKDSTFVLIQKQDDKVITEDLALQKVKEGDYPVAVIIPENTTVVLVNKANKLSNALAQGMGMPAALPVNDNKDSAVIQIVFDPTSQYTFRSSVTFALNQFIAQIQMQLLVDRLSKSSGDTSLSNALLSESLQSIYLKETQADDANERFVITNSVQHNVPAWTIFGMFLIVVPIAGNMIREREEGSSVRLKLIPNTTVRIAFGKTLFYILLCLVQFLVMMLIGIFILPLTGLPSLYLGQHPFTLIPMAIVIAFTATAYGLFIGTVFKTANQAMSIGAISVVLVAAIGGMWVPVDILPKFMQKLAMVSPLHWSLQGLNIIMLRGQGFGGIIIPFCIMLLIGSFFTFLGIISRKN